LGTLISVFLANEGKEERKSYIREEKREGRGRCPNLPFLYSSTAWNLVIKNLEKEKEERKRSLSCRRPRNLISIFISIAFLRPGGWEGRGHAREKEGGDRASLITVLLQPAANTEKLLGGETPSNEI